MNIELKDNHSSFIQNDVDDENGRGGVEIHGFVRY